MLESLHRIVMAVNRATSLGDALEVIVHQVKEAVHADVCSVYLTDFERQEHVLMATDGLRPEAVGKVRLPLYQGLIGLVCERAEPINLDDAPGHPRYLFITETGEIQYHGFLGVPIIQNRRVLGVLVVRQQHVRHFDDLEVTFLFTLAAQLAGAIIQAQLNGELAALSQPGNLSRRYLEGRPGANGAALGQAVVVYPEANLEAIPDRASDEPDKEIGHFTAAVAATRQDLRFLKARLETELSTEDLALFDALLLMLDGDTLVNRTIELIQQGSWAQGALRQSILEHAQVFDRMEDVYLRERASDIRDLGRRILLHMAAEPRSAETWPEATVLAGEEISVTQLAEVPPQRLVGIVSARGSSSSHVAILARSMGVPAVLGLDELPVGRLDGRELIVDGYRGRVYISPEAAVKAEYQRLAEAERLLSGELDSLRGTASETPDGVKIDLQLNTGLVAELSAFGAEEASGIGLYRTELPFMVRDHFPPESVQVSLYRHVLETFAPRPVTMRTLDIGGDKPLPYFPITESNPFLGWRGIRVSLGHPEIFLAQIRAMLRAAIGLNNLRILLPMISTLSELDEAMLLITRAHDELRDEGHPVSLPKIGAMVEVPAAVYQLDAMSRRVAFFSLGTNDLTQYLLAVDRNNPRVAELYDELHPVIIRVLHQVVEEAAARHIPLTVCGEMAGNPLAVILLIGMGVNSLSMNAASLLRIKWVIRRFTKGKARSLLNQALRQDDAAGVRRLLLGAIDEMGLSALVRPERGLSS